MAFVNDQIYYLVQMQQELDNARRHIDMLTNKSRQATDELNMLRNQGHLLFRILFDHLRSYLTVGRFHLLHSRPGVVHYHHHQLDHHFTMLFLTMDFQELFLSFRRHLRHMSLQLCKRIFLHSSGLMELMKSPVMHDMTLISLIRMIRWFNNSSCWKNWMKSSVASSKITRSCCSSWR